MAAGFCLLGDLLLQETIVRGNSATGTVDSPIRGGGVAAWGGTADVDRSWIDENESDFGGGLFYCDTAGGTISRSTLSNNRGGGLHSHSDTDLTVSNSTFSANLGGQGAIFNGQRDGVDVANGSSSRPLLSSDGRYITFESRASNLVEGDTNATFGNGTGDIFVYDQVLGSIERVNVNDNGEQADHRDDEEYAVSVVGSLSGDGRFVSFSSSASNLVPDDTNSRSDIFVFDRDTDTIKHVIAGYYECLAGDFSSSSLSADGHFVAIEANVDGCEKSVFVVDLQNDTFERITSGDWQ